MLLGEVLLTASEIEKSFDGRQILKDTSFTIHGGSRIGVIGPNGSGKSTFMRILAGQDDQFSGALKIHPNVRVGYIEQEPTLDESKTVRENVEIGLAHVHKIIEKYNAVCDGYSAESDERKQQRLLDKMDRLQEEIEAVDGWEWEHQLELAMEALRVPDPELPVKGLSGGERRRVALCREIVSCPDLLILDEPTNHLDASTIEWLEVFIDKYPGTVVMVTHDRYFLDNVANFMVELESGKLHIYEGNYSDYLTRKSEIMAVRARSDVRRDKELERELAWMNSTPSARTSKSKARVKNYEQLTEQRAEEGLDQINLVIPPGPRLGSKVLKITGLKKGYGDRTLINGFDLELVPGQIVGITGPNGVGKTTLFRMITGQEKPDAGSIEIGPTVNLTYVDQTRDDLNPEKTVYEEISEGRDIIEVGGREFHIREYLSGFQFKGSAQQTKVGKLSGGERNRLLLAKTMRRGANLLLLDEPTNDLDLTTLRVLEEALETFAGSAIIVSHDRFFLDRLANSLVLFEDHVKGDDDSPRPRVFKGNFEHYFDVRKGELEAAGIKEGKYRKTTYRKVRK
jgi:ATP-binding cassette ChvD family protein